MDIAAYYTELDFELFQLPTLELVQRNFDEVAREELDEQGDRAAWVAEFDGEMAGLVFARVKPPIASASRQLVRDLSRTRLIVDALGVRTRFWRRGIGRLLLERAERWGRTRGAAVVLLDTYIHSPVSLRFYEDGMGYVRRSVQFRKPLA
jgi:GNAT superfamily N-acetyltransferase